MKIWDTNKLENLPQASQHEVVKISKKLRKGRDSIVYFAEEILGVRLHDGQKKYLAETHPEHFKLRRKNILAPSLALPLVPPEAKASIAA